MGNHCASAFRLPGADVRGRAGGSWLVALLGMCAVSVLALPSTAGELPTNARPEFKVQTAREYLRDLAQSIPAELGTNAEALYTQARLNSALGEKDEAERLAREALTMETNRADIAVFLAQMLVRKDRLEQAAGFLRQAVRANPAIAGGQRQLGMVLDRLGDAHRAQEAFLAAVSVNPKDAEAWLLLGKSFLDQGQLEAAVTNLEAACRLDPESANAYYPLFQAHSRLGHKEAADKALKSFQELKKVEKAGMGTFDDEATWDNEGKLRSFTAGFHNELAGILLRQGKGTLAETHLRQAIQIAPPETQAREILSDYYVRNGRLVEARDVLEELARLQPKQAAPQLNLGTVLLQLRDYSAATEALKSALKLDPKQPQALHNLARHYLTSRQQLPEALELCQRLVACSPEAASYDLLGWACYANGQTNAALKALSQAVEKAPDNPGYRQRYERLKQLAGK